MISKPIDLIVAVSMHDCANIIGALGRMTKSADIPYPIDREVNETIARRLLADIAMSADMKHVFAALKVVGAPCSSDDIAEGRKAIMERVS